MARLVQAAAAKGEGAAREQVELPEDPGTCSRPGPHLPLVISS